MLDEEKIDATGSYVRKAFKNYLADFVPLNPPLTDNHFSKKPLTESPLSFSGIFFLKGLKMMFLALNKVKNGPKRAEMYEKGVLGPKIPVFCATFLAAFWVPPPP